MMAVQVIYSKNRLKNEFPNHFEIIKIVNTLDDITLQRLYNDPSMTAKRFIEVANKHYPNLKEDDRLYFYTTEFKPNLIINDDF